MGKASAPSKKLQPSIKQVERRMFKRMVGKEAAGAEVARRGRQKNHPPCRQVEVHPSHPMARIHRQAEGRQSLVLGGSTVNQALVTQPSDSSGTALRKQLLPFFLFVLPRVMSHKGVFVGRTRKLAAGMGKSGGKAESTGRWQEVV